MTKISIPIILPFGCINIENLSGHMFRLPINELRNLSQHSETIIEYKLEVIKGHDAFKDITNIEHHGFTLDSKLIQHYISRHDEVSSFYTINIEVYTDIETLSKKYSAPQDIYRDIILNLTLFIHAHFFISGYSRFSPILVLNGSKFLFHSRLAYMQNPWQDWFNDKWSLRILLDENLKKKINSKSKFYDLLIPHIKKSVQPLDINIALNNKDIKNTLLLSRALSEILRFHPSHDFSAIIGLLTAYIEGILKIRGENRYKFKIKICNLLKDKTLGKALNDIYDSRSSFFHSAEYAQLNDIFEFVSIDFLFYVIKEIFNYDTKIKKDTFDFPI